jgi:hypothetical protein
MKIEIPEEFNVPKSNQLSHMKIIEIAYGKFSSISHLHRNFQNGIKRLRITLDVNNHFQGNGSFAFVFNQLLTVLPTLAQHKCCENWMGPAPAPKLNSGISIKKVGDSTDFAHLIEHVIIDLMCNLGKMQTCSGITCGYEEPRNRFDLFVECSDKKFGIFSANLAVYLVDRLLTEKKLPEYTPETLALARLLQAQKRKKITPEKLSSKQNWDSRLVTKLWDRLEDLQFFHRENG